MKWIVNADDYGLNESVTDAIDEAFQKGLVTDTTLMANGDAFSYAVEHIKEKLAPPVGIHINLTNGKPLTDKIAKDSFFCDREGNFHGKFSRVKPLSKKQKKELFAEVDAQIQKCEDAGIQLTHADSHHHTHMALNLRGTVLHALKKHGIQKIRSFYTVGRIPFPKKAITFLEKQFSDKMRGVQSTRFFGDLEDCKKTPPKGNKIAEIMVHPMYLDGKLIDTKSQSNPHGEPLETVAEVADFQNLISYKDV